MEHQVFLKVEYLLHLTIHTRSPLMMGTGPQMGILLTPFLVKRGKGAEAAGAVEVATVQMLSLIHI